MDESDVARRAAQDAADAAERALAAAREATQAAEVAEEAAGKAEMPYPESAGPVDVSEESYLPVRGSDKLGEEGLGDGGL